MIYRSNCLFGVDVLVDFGVKRAGCADYSMPDCELTMKNTRLDSSDGVVRARRLHLRGGGGASLGLSLGACVVISAASTVLGQSGTPVPHQFVVRVGSSATIETIAAGIGATIQRRDDVSRAYLVETGEASNDDETEVELSGDGGVDGAERNRVILPPESHTQSFFLNVIEPDYVNQPALDLTGMRGAHSLSVGTGVVVAILDTGVDSHPMFAGLLLAGYDAINETAGGGEQANMLDDDGDGLIDEAVGHGTLVAGVVHAAAPGAMLLPVRVLNSDGVGTSFSVATGIRWAIANGAQVINLSLSTPIESGIMADAVREARAAGIVVVAAVGNGGVNEAAFPADNGGVLGVAATAPDDRLAAFSNFGTSVSLCAPGVGIVGTATDGGYWSSNGTSLSAPLVAGAAALLRSYAPSAVLSDISGWLEDSATNIVALNPSMVGAMGSGRLDARVALVLARRDSGCVADLDRDGQLNPDDLADYISAFFAEPPLAEADFNVDGVTNPDDLADYIVAFFEGC